MDVFGGLFGAMMVIVVVLPLVITGVVIGVVVWAIRRAVPSRDDAAVAELRQRYARGEISPAEFEVRLRSLTQDR